MRRYSCEEKNTQKACIDILKLYGYVVIRNNSGKIILGSPNGKKRAIKIGTPGASDIIACSPEGKFVAIEVKSKQGKLTEKQKNFLTKIEKNNGIALVIKDINDLFVFLKDNQSKKI